MKDSGRRISHPAIEFLLLRWNAEKLFGEFLKPAQAKVFRLTHPRLRIDLRLGERHHKGVNGGGSLLSDKTPPRRSQFQIDRADHVESKARHSLQPGRVLAVRLPPGRRWR